MIYSFSYAAGQENSLPEGCKIYDVRHFDDPVNLRIGRDGRDLPVRDYIAEQDGAAELVMDAALYVDSGKDVAFGCYAGMFRSVAFAEILRQYTDAPFIHHKGLEIYQKGIRVWES